MNAAKIVERPEVTQFIQEIEARGEAEALLTILSARGLTVSDAQRATILGCDDATTLDRWIRGAVAADRVEPLLAR